MALIFDLESDGLLDELTKIHCIGIKDTETGELEMYRGVEAEVGALRLKHATEAGTVIAGHNVIGFDIPALQKVFYKWFSVNEAYVLDTMVYARAQWPDLKDSDTKRIKQRKMPGNMWNRQSLEAWGYRLGNYKGDFKGPWDTWTQEMEDYCAQDVEVTHALYDLCVKHHHSDEHRDLEHQVAWIIARQERHGFLFDMEAATKLYAKLVQRRLELTEQLKKVYAPFYTYAGDFTPKRDNKAQGYVGGASCTKVKLVEFNPGSRDHIINRLMKLHGWEPKEFTDNGKPKMDEQVIGQLDIPEAALLKEFFLVEKRIGQVAEGDEAWLRHVKPDGRIHGRINSNGAVTGRMTHSKPNMGQVPATYSAYGEECRVCFTVPKGKVLVGCDADALELRDLAGYMAAYDAGAYIETVLRGEKKLGTDMHSVNCRALGMEPKEVPPALAAIGQQTSGRDVAKTWFYAFIYGAGDEKLGFIMTGKKGEEAKKLGGASRKRFLKNLPALGKLVERVKDKAKVQGYLRGLDGRRLKVRSQHAALNTLLQSAGAVQMKKALVILDQTLKSRGYTPGVHYEFVANVHDEWQIECDEAIGEDVGKAAAESIRLAGEHFKFKCPLAGAYGIGRNWAETH